MPGLLAALWAAALSGAQTASAQWITVGLAVAVAACCAPTAIRGAAAIMMLRLNQDAAVVGAWFAGTAFGALLAALTAAGIDRPPGLEAEPAAAVWFLASGATVLAARHSLRALLARRHGPEAFPAVEPEGSLLLRGAIAVGVGLVPTVTLVVAWNLPESWSAAVPGAVAIGVGALAALLPNARRAAPAALQRFARESLPTADGTVPLHKLADVDCIVIEKGDVLTTSECEIRKVVCLDSGSCEEDVLHLAAVAEYILPANPIRQAILRRARTGLRTVPTIKNFRHHPGRGVSARYSGQELIFGNLEWLRERGWNHTDLEEARRETSELYERGETVLFVCLGGQILGAVSLYDPPRPETDWFLDQISAIGVPIVIVSGDSPQTVRELLGRSRNLEVFAGLRPDDRLGVLHDLRREGERLALVARSGSPLLPGALEIADVVFTLDRKAGTTTVATAGDEPTHQEGASLEQVTFVMRLARNLRREERRTRAFLQLYHWLLAPGVLAVLGAFASWKTWPAWGILLGAVATWVAVPSRRRLAGALARPPGQKKARAEEKSPAKGSDESGARKTRATGSALSDETDRLLVTASESVERELPDDHEDPDGQEDLVRREETETAS